MYIFDFIVSLVPNDDNFLALRSKAFQDPSETNYVNASRIKFNGLDQTFVACQAPLQGSFNHFWQMVIEEKVEVIVMVTQCIKCTIDALGKHS